MSVDFSGFGSFVINDARGINRVLIEIVRTTSTSKFCGPS